MIDDRSPSARRRTAHARCRPHAARRSCAPRWPSSPHGFGGARIDAIAERAGVNKRLIYYYFDGKDELFLAVLEQTYADIRAAEQDSHLASADPVEAVRPGRVHLALLPRAPRNS